jgi:hypothetical protein
MFCRSHARAFIVATALAASLLRAEPASTQKHRIGPGPTVMSDEEKAIVPDSAQGIEHGVILVEEAERDPNSIVYHRRALILSNEAREMADVEIDAGIPGWKLEQWWGRTIHPDGTVHELPRSSVEAQFVRKKGAVERRALRAALPGVTPGCIIDYGYKAIWSGLVPFDRVRIQQEWPVRSFRYRAELDSLIRSAFRLTRTEGLAIQSSYEHGVVLILGTDLPAVAEEPMMPPDHEVRASAVVYPLFWDLTYEKFWNDAGRLTEKYHRATASNQKSIARAISEMGLPAGEAGLEERLRAAYGWIEKNITRTGLRGFEEAQLAKSEEETDRDVIGSVLESRQGNAEELNRFYLAIARALGAEAHLVLAPDRRRNYFDPDFKSLSQFDTAFVAVRPKGASDEDAWIVDAGSGLPFGELPWWNSGCKGLLLDKFEARAISLPIAPAQRNVAESKVEMGFDASIQAWVTKWSQTARGQEGLRERRYLRSLAPSERAQRIAELCGERSDTEVAVAESPGLDAVGRGFELRCETTREESIDQYGAYSLGWTGPWQRALPDLRPGTRRYAVVLQHPRIEIMHFSIDTPEGFEADDPPPPIEIKNGFGKYALKVARTETGYAVERAFALVTLAVPAEDYEKFVQFLTEVERWDSTRLTFRRPEIEP